VYTSRAKPSELRSAFNGWALSREFLLEYGQATLIFVLFSPAQPRRISGVDIPAQLFSLLERSPFLVECAHGRYTFMDGLRRVFGRGKGDSAESKAQDSSPKRSPENSAVLLPDSTRGIAIDEALAFSY
jgi:hypothetical protein